MQSLVIKVEMEQWGVRTLVQRILEGGWLYLRMRKFLSTYNNNPSAGLVLQAFCSFISAELKEYHRLLAVLQAQLGENETTDEGTSVESSASNLTLRRLLVWLQQPFERLKFLNVVCDAIKGELFFKICLFTRKKLEKFRSIFEIYYSLLITFCMKIKKKHFKSCQSFLYNQPIELLIYLFYRVFKDKKGGILLSTLHAYSINGDINKSSLLRSSLATVFI